MGILDLPPQLVEHRKDNHTICLVAGPDTDNGTIPLDITNDYVIRGSDCTSFYEQDNRKPLPKGREPFNKFIHGNNKKRRTY